ncbi:hypothetical protein [Streptomyces sp. NPDC051567]|uniref:hypothetical protein n=1 Tax=Streptomyces sp. NPDC051567 TaxID=3365660 RepID=UPI00379C989E
MGMTVLYIAFGFVALWLLAEVLMQYKARLRWRLLAFTGFLGVVAGVVLPSVPVIVAGAVAFAVGQILVTLSFRKGFEAGWALRRGGAPVRRSGRRRSGGTRPEPTLRVTPVEYGSESAAGAAGAAAGPFPQDGPHHPDRDFAPAPAGGNHPPVPGVEQTAAFRSPFAPDEPDAHQYAAPHDPQTPDGYAYGDGYPADGRQVYAAYSDPYIGTGGGPLQPDAGYAPYDDYPAYPDAGHPAYPDYAPYGGPYPGQTPAQYAMDTPPGGVWVPQQRANDQTAQPYPAPAAGEDPDRPPQDHPHQGTGDHGQHRY